MAASCAALLLSLCLSPLLVASEPVDNGLTGDPEITCADSYIGVHFSTRNNFEGNVFVMDKYADPECRESGNGTMRGAGLRLPFSSCGVGRRRSLDPRGVFVTTMVVISFHSQFITKVDKAYMLQCYYMEKDKIVMTEITVAMLTTSFQTAVVPMPVCRYEVLSGGPSGPPIRFASIGDKVYHKWTCDSDTVDTFCMLVHSCKVSDGAGDEVALLDPNGCSIDPHLLDNLDYVSDLMAGKEAHVFKYADRNRLFFDCQIAISVRDPQLPCPLPENCHQPIRRRGKRQLPPSPLSPHPQLPPLSSPAQLCMSVGGVSAYAAFNAFLIVVSALLLLSAFRDSQSPLKLDQDHSQDSALSTFRLY